MTEHAPGGVRFEAFDFAEDVLTDFGELTISESDEALQKTKTRTNFFADSDNEFRRWLFQVVYFSNKSGNFNSKVWHDSASWAGAGKQRQVLFSNSHLLTSHHHRHTTSSTAAITDHFVLVLLSRGYQFHRQLHHQLCSLPTFASCMSRDAASAYAIRVANIVTDAVRLPRRHVATNIVRSLLCWLKR